jgi:copper chaperone
MIPEFIKEKVMIVFKVDDMSCNHCVNAITDAVREADRDAKVTIDLAARRVAIEPVAARSEVLHAAIEEAGFTPVLQG